ncbi:universal stress protein [Natrialbaceae archaeon AArc-T1-2]|uniref:universal stress protein n=1 Tax=Natrialbaceae archaeon AArc-T1-2 TaxID=3053904 RepID=UPI00255B0662|nr:universal stress protein [Natrialbaceae archaeon AArc-T1-2]WIV66400.1 universal stress protein [Natrialbaceae archaeon AArc-T1-2]
MDTFLVPVTSHPGWARDVATAATEIESPEDAEGIVAHVFEDGEVESTRSNLELPADETATLDELAARKSGVSTTVAELEDAGIDARVRGVRAGDEPGDAIVSAAERAGVDRIYLYSRKRSPAGKAVFGSTVQRVLLSASCPVVVLPYGAR